MGGRSVGITNVDGTYYAVHNVCPHALAPICMGELKGTMLPSRPGELEYGLEGLVLRCTWHGWEFDIRSGEALFGTDPRRLLTFPVRVEAGQVVVRMRPRHAPAAR